MSLIARERRDKFLLTQEEQETKIDDIKNILKLHKEYLSLHNENEIRSAEEFAPELGVLEIMTAAKNGQNIEDDIADKPIQYYKTAAGKLHPFHVFIET